MHSSSTKKSKILLIGSGALKIGEAGEFDYSGSQAIKALKAEGVRCVLINPNIATNQTSKNMADRTYFLPVTPYFVEKLIEKERPDGVLLSFGGQTALNCGVELFKSGVFQKYGVEVLGTPVETIEKTEDRALFVEKLREIDVLCPISQAVSSVEEALAVAEKIGYPVMMRIAFALGGLGSGPAFSKEELRQKTGEAFNYTSQILIEEYLKGWKEIEYEVVRDRYDNAITVCNMENFDPLGIHTGESIVVAPSQTLDDQEYQNLRSIALKVARHLGVVGECNIQYALNPHNGEVRVIEVNARLSRSSALASKATGYPLAYVAAKIALGYALSEITNQVTKTTMACFEPALDYIVVKIPRWDLKKFPLVQKELSSSMKSVGEVMAIGRNFSEALQKAIRMLDIGFQGFIGNAAGLVPEADNPIRDKILALLQQPTEERLMHLAAAFKLGMTVEEIRQHTKIDPWFLAVLKELSDFGSYLANFKGGLLPKKDLLKAKQLGFSDGQLAKLLELEEHVIEQARLRYGIAPFIKKIDTLAGEFLAATNYMYLTYNADQDDLLPDHNKKKVLVVGSGAYRIGSSVEFDWCSVGAVKAFSKLGYQTYLLNCNPETVSTDYDEVDCLFLEEIKLETIQAIYRKAGIQSVLISVGGQTSNNLVLGLREVGIPILGTSADNIDRAEDREKFSAILDQENIAQPRWKRVTTKESLEQFIAEIGFPVLIRPSYVLSGTAMGIANQQEELNQFLSKAAVFSREHPIVVSEFIENAKELEFDAVSFQGEVSIFAISEHVENAGVHSGDATLVYPAQRTYVESMRKIIKIGRTLARVLQISGPFNIQFLAKGPHILVIECNLRASRSFPFVSKVSGIDFIEESVRASLGLKPSLVVDSFPNYDHVAVKASQFSFTRLLKADPILGVEMSSTGEVGCFGDDFDEALLKSLLSVGYRIPLRKVLLSLGPEVNKLDFIPLAKNIQAKNIEIFCTTGTFKHFIEHGVQAELLTWPEEQGNSVMEALDQVKFDLVVNIPKNYSKQELDNDYRLRRKAVDLNMPLITNLQLAKRFLEAYLAKNLEDLKIKAWDSYLEA